MDIGQLFIFTCGMCPPAADRISKHIMDVITRDMESTLHDNSNQNTCSFDQCYVAQCTILEGLMESNANNQPFIRLTISHIICEPAQINADTPLKTLLDMNIANIVSLNASIVCTESCFQDIISQSRVQEIIYQSREKLLYLSLKDNGKISLNGLQLKYLRCVGATDLTNLDCSNMVECALSATPLTEKCVFERMKGTGGNIRLFHIDECTSISLLSMALPNLRSLHTFELSNTVLLNTQLHEVMPQ
ncbi:hypothetical protein DPMN_096878 [Dreissena polymorpha]|uniref:Uncharacterized protein n=1 Tax=Dreissena polymorpha TaxID=45954 RepID=A0A9D4R424_DREPO|nr:hypothetical protein DPMN_096878 [Dreissena polymorpha]